VNSRMVLMNSSEFQVGLNACKRLCTAADGAASKSMTGPRVSPSLSSLPLVSAAGLWTPLHYQLVRSDLFADVGPGPFPCLTDDHTELSWLRFRQILPPVLHV